MISLNDLRKFKAEGRKFSCLTCYDASMAKAMELAEIDTILIGDSLGMAIQGRDSTLPVTVEDMAYHTAAIRRGNQHALIMTDLPFMSYATLNDALQSSKVVMQAGAQMVKVEGGAWLAETVQVLTRNGIPVCVHLGLTPQSVHVFGGYKLQARTREAAQNHAPSHRHVAQLSVHAEFSLLHRSVNLNLKYVHPNGVNVHVPTLVQNVAAHPAKPTVPSLC